MNRKSGKEHEQTKELQIDKEELEALSARVTERRLEEEDWQRLHRYLVLLLKLTKVLEYGRVRMRKLMRILFGKRTEKDAPEEGQKGKDKDPSPPASPAAARPHRRRCSCGSAARRCRRCRGAPIASRSSRSAAASARPGFTGR